MTTFLRDERNRLELTQAEVSKAIGVGKTTFLRWEAGNPIPSDKLIALSDIGFDINYVLKGCKEEPLPAKSSQSSALQTSHADLTPVPQYDLAASAGGGALVIAEHPIARFELSTRWLQQNNLHNKKLTVVPVRGDSMEHTLCDGDLTLVSLIDDPADARDGVCVLRFDDEIFVKRIQYDFKSKGYKVTSDNTAYSGFFVEVEDIESGRFSVLGRVERVLQRARKVD
ncbi:MAG: phage repressor protein C with HTH and peptisase S24 domain [Pseudoalteromonas tetraodonis]|jgi:phage repressor protein C with HTH and peptisase S24 domain|uniref:XRE family transcriptional regulator n=1 Tax=Pseudoalteromonas tetraodonis TaxID=43659 RepID=UPI0039898340